MCPGGHAQKDYVICQGHTARKWWSQDSNYICLLWPLAQTVGLLSEYGSGREGLGRKGWELKGAYDGFSLFQFRPTFSILYMVKFQINKEQSFDLEVSEHKSFLEIVQE